MSSGFPLLFLPLLPQLEVIQYMKLEHIVKLSACSKRAAAFVSGCNIQLKSISYEFGDDNCEYVQVCLKGVGAAQFEPFFIHSQLAARQIWTLNRSPFFDSLEDWITDQPNRMFHGMLVNNYESVIGHVTSVFKRVETVDVTLSTGTDFTRVLHLFGGRISGMLAFVDSRLRLSVEKFNYLMSNMYATILRMNVGVRLGIDYKEGFTSRDVVINFGSWVHVDAIINSTSEDISVWNCRKFGPVDFNTLLKFWVAGDHMHNLKNLELLGFFRFTRRAMNRVLDDIETVQWVPSAQQNERVYDEEAMDWIDGRVIVGRRAVVRVLANRLRLVRLSPIV